MEYSLLDFIGLLFPARRIGFLIVHSRAPHDVWLSSFRTPCGCCVPDRISCKAGVGSEQCQARTAFHQCHAVLNLLNRLTATEDTGLREELVGRLAEYLAAVHRMETGRELTLGALCELTRSYAAMRYLMADAIEPRIDHGEGDFGLRTEQWTEMTAFIQTGIDSLLEDYTSRVSLSIRRFGWWQVELTMLAKASPGHVRTHPHEWMPLPDGSGHVRSARFTAISRPLMPR